MGRVVGGWWGKAGTYELRWLTFGKDLLVGGKLFLNLPVVWLGHERGGEGSNTSTAIAILTWAIRQRAAIALALRGEHILRRRLVWLTKLVIHVSLPTLGSPTLSPAPSHPPQQKLKLTAAL